MTYGNDRKPGHLPRIRLDPLLSLEERTQALRQKLAALLATLESQDDQLKQLDQEECERRQLLIGMDDMAERIRWEQELNIQIDMFRKDLLNTATEIARTVHNPNMRVFFFGHLQVIFNHLKISLHNIWYD
jgi:hypothetical protein